jgi:CDP-diacylglycerol--glycerol-3-phosphate 3-phosphatidyltransferase
VAGEGAKDKNPQGISRTIMKSRLRKDITNLPNTLTGIRLAFIPPLFIFLNFQGRWASFFAALAFGLASITDILDGYFARKYGTITVLGKFLDPLADKLLISITMIMLIPLERIPLWMVIVIIAREMAVTGLRGIAVSEGIVIQASTLGKYKTIFQSTAIAGLCLHYSYFDVDFHVVGMVFLWPALVLTLWSGWEYFRQFKQVFFPAK